MFNVQLVSTPEALRGRAIALDLTIPIDNKLGFCHHLIGVYAPWNPGGENDDEHLFWPEITCLSNSATFSWSLHGDLNATLLASESSSMSLNVSSSCLAYSHFLNSTDGIDLWRTQAECDVNQHYTHRTQQNTTNLTPVTCNIIDQSAISRIGTLSGTISIMSDFIPCTDHRPIYAQIILLSPPSIQLNPSCSQRFQAMYGWETKWRKSALYVYNTTPPNCHEAHMPSVDYTNPQADTVTWHEVPIITNNTTFLWVLIN